MGYINKIYSHFFCTTISKTNDNKPKVEPKNLESENKSNETKDEIIPVTTELVSSFMISDVLQAVGTVNAFHDVDISSEVSGKVEKMLVKIGDKVKKGDTLIISREYRD